MEQQNSAPPSTLLYYTSAYLLSGPPRGRMKGQYTNIVNCSNYLHVHFKLHMSVPATCTHLHSSPPYTVPVIPRHLPPFNSLYFQFYLLPLSIYQAPFHCQCILNCLFEVIQLLIIVFKLLLALCQQEHTEWLHFGGTILVLTNFDLVLQSEREGPNRFIRLQCNPTYMYIFTIHFTR